MAGLKIAMINGIKPMAGSGDGITEYAYRMYLQLEQQNRIDLVYAIEKARKNDVFGLLKINSLLSSAARRAGEGGYDIFHIMNQEVGFTAKDIKSADSANKIITTIHDLSRFERGLHKGALQNAYNAMVRRSVSSAVQNSDFMLFDSQQTFKDVRKRFKSSKGAVVNIGIESQFFSTTKATNKKDFTVGYIGSFSYHKNVIMLLKAANLLKDSAIGFRVYGVGNEGKNLTEYKRSNGLKKVELMGFAAENRKMEIYDSFSAFVFPSLYEGFGLPILEAQARGVPVVVYKHGRVSEEIKKYCIGAEDEEDMARKILYLKENGYDESKKRRAMTYARSFTWEKCAKETSKIYEKFA